MATQAVLIAETIAGMKRALSGHQYSSDSDDSFHKPSNRGNKLKRKAQLVHEGQLDLTNGPKAYRRGIEHAGYHRHILSRNPRRYDDDGDELDDDDVDEQADTAAAARNPYNDIRLESLLAPLTSAADLPNHPSLATPYISNTLTEMAQQACEMVQRERKTLWSAKHLLTKLRGDETWIPCGALDSADDEAVFGMDLLYTTVSNGSQPKQSKKNHQHLTNGQLPVNAQDESTAEPVPESGDKPIRSMDRIREDLDVEPRTHAMEITNDGTTDPKHLGVEIPEHVDMQTPQYDIDPLAGPVKPTEEADGPVLDKGIPEAQYPLETPNKSSLLGHEKDIVTVPPLNGGTIENTRTTHRTNNEILELTEPSPETAIFEVTNGTKDDTIDPANLDPRGGISEEKRIPATEVEGRDEEAPTASSTTPPPPHRMTTRAQAQAASSNSNPASATLTRSPSPSTWAPPIIHPLYLIPPSAIPDRNFGLPTQEADDVRRVLMLYVQKQEEVCRGAERLYEGLLKADRMRKTVLKWCKAEGHIGEMSDGEDWYDREEWGLEEDLKKGHEEEEEEGGGHAKKTRGRRA